MKSDFSTICFQKTARLEAVSPGTPFLISYSTTPSDSFLHHSVFLLHASHLVIIMTIYLLLLVCLCFACLCARKEVPPLPQMISVFQSSGLKTEGFMTLCCGPCKGITEGEKRKGRYLTQCFLLSPLTGPGLTEAVPQEPTSRY